MSAVQLVLAVALLTAPPDAPTSGEDTELLNNVCPAVQQLALQLEILDPREVKYILNRPEDYASDLKLLRARYHDLASAPLANDAYRFPDRNSVNELLTFNRAFRQNLDARQAVETVRQWELREALQETDRLYKIWDALRDARCGYYYVTVRRQALKQLREMIGDQAYYAGVMPPYVPTWRLMPLD
jgi:hypothetical protein